MRPVCSNNNRQVDVYYATTRNVAPLASDLRRAFGKEAADQDRCRYGATTVSIPSPHPVGDQKSVSMTAFDPPLASEGLRAETFKERLSEQLRGGSKRPLIVYVHGFNNSFDVAARRAAVFAHDLQPLVAAKPVIFSWPSAQRLTAYTVDEDKALLNQEHARTFLEMLRGREGQAPVVLIGHSLGARVLTYALRDLYLSNSGPGRTPPYMFDHLVLLQPDVNTDYFDINLDRVRALCRTVTVYASNKDRAIQASRLLHRAPRVGDLRRRRHLKHVDVIDASAARTDLLGHSYDGAALFADLRALLDGKAAKDRKGKTLEPLPGGRWALKRVPADTTLTLAERSPERSLTAAAIENPEVKKPGDN